MITGAPTPGYPTGLTTAAPAPGGLDEHFITRTDPCPSGAGDVLTTTQDDPLYPGGLTTTPLGPKKGFGFGPTFGPPATG